MLLHVHMYCGLQRAGITPLMMASENGHIDVVGYLVEGKAKTNAERYDVSSAVTVRLMHGWF